MENKYSITKEFNTLKPKAGKAAGKAANSAGDGERLPDCVGDEPLEDDQKSPRAAEGIRTARLTSREKIKAGPSLPAESSFENLPCLFQV